MLNIDLPIVNRKEKISFIVEFSSIFKKLRDKEKDVLNILLLYQDALNYNILIDYDLRVRMREELGISEHNFNNLISSLRKKGVILDNKINKYYVNLVQQDSIQITFNAQ